MEISIGGKTTTVNRWSTGDPVNHGKMVAIDTETHLISDVTPWEYPPVVVMTVYSGGTHADLVMWQDIDEYLNKLFQKDRGYVFHNAPFDIGVLGFDRWVDLVERNKIYDTGLQWVLDKLETQGLSDENKRYPSLADVVKDVVGVVMDKNADIRLTFNRDTPVDDGHAIYACVDAILTWRACALMRSKKTMDIQIKGFLMLDAISRNGLLVDRDRMDELRSKYLQTMEEEKQTLKSWGIDLDDSKTTTEKLCIIARTFGFAVKEIEQETDADEDGDDEEEAVVKVKPEERVWLLKQLLHLLLTQGVPDKDSLQQLQGSWSPAMEREFKKAIKDLPPISENVPTLTALRKPVAINFLYYMANNPCTPDEASIALDQYWLANDGWVAPKKGSNTVLQELMEEAAERVKYEFERTATGKIKLTAEVVDELPSNVLNAIPFMPSWQKYKHAEKLYSTFLNPENVKIDNRVHPRVTPILATGRTSMSAPNLQNISKEPGIREQYIASPGHVLCSCDYNQQELIALAQACYTRYGESRLRDLLNHDIDIHAYMAGVLGERYKGLPEFTIADEDIVAAYKDRLSDFRHTDPGRFGELRHLSKAANFGFPGGLGAPRFTTYARGYGVELDEAYAREIRNAWMRAFPEMDRHLQPTPMVSSRYRDRFQVATLTGRLRVNCTFCAACNSEFQGLAADCSKLAGWRLLKEGYFLVAFIHDEFIAELPIDEHLTARAKYMAQVMVEEMQKLTPDVKVKAEPALMRRWSKDAEAWYDGEGDLIPWELVPKQNLHGSLAPIEWGDLSSKSKERILAWKKTLRDLATA